MKQTTETIQTDIELMLEKAYEIRVSNLSKSIAITEEVLSKSRDAKIPSLIAHSLSRLSLYNMIQGASEKSLQLSLEAIEIYKEIDDERGIANVNYSIAGIHYKSNNYHLGMVYLLDCLMTFRKYKDYHNESRTLKSLGTIYEFLGDQPNAKDAYESAVKAAKLAGDKNLESNVYNPLSGLLLKLKKHKKAMELIALSVAMKQETGDIRGEAFAVYGRGKVHLYNKDFKEAENDFNTALKTHQKFNDQLGITMTHIKIAQLLHATGKRSEAKNVLKKAIIYCERNNILIFKIKSYQHMYRAYREEGDSENALKYLEYYVKIKEQTTSSQIIKVIENYEAAAKIKRSEREARLELEKAAIEVGKKRAEQSAVIKQEFLSAMSHEIRTPLNAVTSIISLLEERSSESEKQLLTSLRFSSKNLLRIIDDILDFSKLESNKMQLEGRPTFFRKLIENTRQTYMGMAKEKGLALKVHVDTNVAGSYKIDETKVFQILGNLLSNAIKYTEQGTVSVDISLKKAYKHKDSLLFKVTDTGVGISKADQARLFESFYMPRAITTRSFGGTGLGLAIVKKLVELHGSTISIKSEKEEGSEFSFTLSLEKSQAPTQLRKASVASLDGKQVILAEDNEINAMVVTKILQRWGIKVLRVKNGAEALQRASSQKVDTILMDIHMPIMNGFEATKQIRSSKNKNSTTPIYALTADITALGSDDYAHLFNGFLSKPMQIDRLLEALLTVEVGTSIA